MENFDAFQKRRFETQIREKRPSEILSVKQVNLATMTTSSAKSYCYAADLATTSNAGRLWFMEHIRIQSARAHSIKSPTKLKGLHALPGGLRDDALSLYQLVYIVRQEVEVV